MPPLRCGLRRIKDDGTSSFVTRFKKSMLILITFYQSRAKKSMLILQN
jgi:hypothetical protein